MRSVTDEFGRVDILVNNAVLEAVVPDLAAYEQLLLDRVLAIDPVRDARSTFVIRTLRSRGPIPDRLGRTYRVRHSRESVRDGA